MQSMLLGMSDDFHGSTGLVNSLGGGCGPERDYYGVYKKGGNPYSLVAWVGVIVAKVGDDEYSARYVLPLNKDDNPWLTFPTVVQNTINGLIESIQSANKSSARRAGCDRHELVPL